MSILFYDSLLVLTELDLKIKKQVSSSEEREELWQVVEEIIHHEVIGCCLTHLPTNYHNEFLNKFHISPHDKKLFKYLNQKTKKNMKKIIREEIKNLTKDLLLLDSNKM